MPKSVLGIKLRTDSEYGNLLLCSGSLLSGGGGWWDSKCLLPCSGFRASDLRFPTLGKAPASLGSSSPSSTGSRSARTVSQTATTTATRSWTNLLLAARAAHMLWDGLRTSASLPGPFAAPAEDGRLAFCSRRSDAVVSQRLPDVLRRPGQDSRGLRLRLVRRHHCRAHGCLYGPVPGTRGSLAMLAKGNQSH